MHDPCERICAVISIRGCDTGESWCLSVWRCVVSRKYSDVGLVEVWDRRQAGESSRSIGRRVGRSAAAIRALVESSGGVRPRQRCRGSRQLSLAEREEISRGLAAGESMRSIASGLGRAPSTVSRELARSGGGGALLWGHPSGEWLLFSHLGGCPRFFGGRSPSDNLLALGPGPCPPGCSVG